MQPTPPRFSPIAIVGRACTLPLADTPEELFRNVRERRSCVSTVPEGRWGLPPALALAAERAPSAKDRSWSAVGGYLRGFEDIFDPSGFGISAAEVLRLDPVFQWTLHTVREALRSAGSLDAASAAGTGLVLGNLSFPSAGLARFAESTWLAGQTHGPTLPGPDTRHAFNRFSSGLPALLTAEALGLGAKAFALDAACASSLYAIKLACDRLHDGKADTVVAGAVNSADDLFIHVGFSALAALSKTGRTRPFHAEADGLVPAEGAAFVVLMRLEDALARNKRVLGVIRGVGLSNDGRGRGFLAPSEEGQERAMRAAYAVSGLAPHDIQLLECHATGTPVGDATEVRSSAAVFRDLVELPVGSLKSNLGHLITAAGTAGLLKVLGAMEAGILPPSLHADVEHLNPAFEGTPLRVVQTEEPWQAPQRRAGVSAFGFGGNNAHLIVEQWTGDLPISAPRAAAVSGAVPATVRREAVAIVGIGARVGNGDSAHDWTRALLAGAGSAEPRREIAVSLGGLRFPPRDLQQTLPQQLTILEAAREAADGISLPRTRTAVLVGMGCDAEVARYGARWRVPAWANDAATSGAADSPWMTAAREAFVPVLESAGVIGTMPNIVANRINSQLDLAGPSFSVSAEEASGTTALAIAERALLAGEIDAAVVGAVDLSHEPVHQAALAALGEKRPVGDAAVVLIVKRLADARRDGDEVLALLDEPRVRAAHIPGASSLPAAERFVFGDGEKALDLGAAFGRAHAASGLFHVAAAALALHHGAKPHLREPATPWLGERLAAVTTVPLAHGPAGAATSTETIRLRAVETPVPFFARSAPTFVTYRGDSREAVLAAAKADDRSTATTSTGALRLVIASGEEAQHTSRLALAVRFLEGSLDRRPEGVAFGDASVLAAGELAFVYGGAASAYPTMGRELLLAVPGLAENLAARCGNLAQLLPWALGERELEPAHPLEKLWGSTFLSQIHTELSRSVLGLQPAASLGFSSGESNALFALGAWTDLEAMVTATDTSPLFRTELAGDFAAARRVWARAGEAGVSWAAYVVTASRADVERALEGEAHVHLLIVNSPDECVVGGESLGASRVVDRLGSGKATRLAYELAAHAPELREVERAWWELHHRPTSPVPGVRFYSAGAEGPLVTTPEAVADAITAQAIGTLDFPRLVERAYADGVRIFVEHGPRAGLTRNIRRILGERPHLAVALDAGHEGSIATVVDAVVQLLAAGVAVDADAFSRVVAEGAVDVSAAPLATPAVAAPTLRIPAHRPFPRLPPQEPSVQTREAPAAVRPTSPSGPQPQRMAPAPRLPSVLGGATSAPASAPRAPAIPVPSPRPPSAPPPSLFAASAQVDVSSTPVFVASDESVAVGTTSPASAEIIARISAHRQQVARLHNDYLSSQAALHGQFLALRQRSEQALLDGYRAAMLGSDPASAALSFAPPAPALLASQVTTTSATPAPHSAPPTLARTALALTEEAPAALPLAPSPPRAPIAPSAPTKPPVASPPVVAPAATPKSTAAPATLPGPKFDRKQLETLASGAISSVFGPAFAGQDSFHRQVRMPEPPLLLADRVTGIDAVAQSMGTGTIWTETDVTPASWYLDRQGRMPAGIMIESGQADLLLISWLGADTQNRGERVYRLLGCELTYHGSLPQPGDTLAYDIHVDGHAAQGDVRLFFFHYDCHVRGEPRLSVRHGQAGFFTDAELADSAGVLWDPLTERPKDGPLDPPHTVCSKRALSKTELRAFADGDAFACFGRGWERAQTHVRTPGITTGRMLFLDEITELDPRGGPWGRGYLRGETKISPNDWFFDGHFKNDPCMPGTLMFEGCLQAMAVAMAGMGFTIDRDGWRFEPVPEEKYSLRCRGQVTPSSQHLTYEVFVCEVVAGPVPMLFADLLCTVDGRKAFHAKRVGLRLVPDWPLSHWRGLGPAKVQETGAPLALREQGGLVGYTDPEEVAVVDGFRFGYDSLIACAWGPPSEAFGPFYARYDSPRKVARLPGPPYHFMSRVSHIDGPIGGMKAGIKTEIAYDVPEAVWYFEQNGYPTMPFCVLLEAALQPCGWLASFVGSANSSEIDLLFRNLDGTGTLHAEILPGQTLRTRVEITSISSSAGMIIESFKVSCLVKDKVVYDMTTVFGFFPKEAFDDQVGLPVSDEERARMTSPATDVIDLRNQPARYCGGTLCLPKPMLLMLDRVTGHWPTGGKKGLGYLRAEKRVDQNEWFFKAHFFQDPVQPGSLGIEALTQLLQFFMLETNMGEGMQNPRFEPLMLGKPLTWKYRGQVVPKNELIESEIEIIEIGEDEHGRFAVCDGFLWVDGKRIYGAKNLGMRIVDGPAPAPPEPGRGPSSTHSVEASGTPDHTEETLDPAVDTWLGDHRPTWTAPALPMMSMVDRLVAAVEHETGERVTSLTNVRAHRWLPFAEGAGPIRLRTEISEPSAGGRLVTLLAYREATDPALSRFEPVASATAFLGAVEAAPAPFAPLPAEGRESMPDPYESGALFHGPAFHYLESLTLGAEGSTAHLSAGRGTVPRGALHQGLLDAATHGIPHDAFHRWSSEIGADFVGYPYKISKLSLFAPLPATGAVRVEARFAGFDGDARFPAIELQLIDEATNAVLVALRLIEILLPKGPLGSAPLADRRAFLRDRKFVPTVALSTYDAERGVTRLSAEVVQQSDWLAGTVASVYGVAPERQRHREDLVLEVAVREHIARQAFVHPSALVVDADGLGAFAAIRPLRHHTVTVQRDDETGDVEVRDRAPARQDIGQVRTYWDARFAMGPWPVEDLYYGLIERFVGDVILTDPAAFAAVRGRSSLYLGNHQVGVESLLFSILGSALSGTPTVTLAKAEHRTSWLGRLIAHSFSYPGVVDPNVITFFDREDKESLVQIVGDLSQAMATTGKSAMVHVEGTRAFSCRTPVIKMSSVFLDMALAVRAPVIPIRFTGALPVEPLETRIEFPIGYGRQDIWIGRPILPEELETLPYKDRKPFVIAAMNALGPQADEPSAPDPSFAEAVRGWQAHTGVDAEHAVLFETLAALPHPTDEVRTILEGARRGEVRFDDSPKGKWLAELARRLFGDAEGQGRGPHVFG
jgi:PfaB family protein